MLGTLFTWVALTLGLYLGNPLIRWLVGPPAGFYEDYTTWQALAQPLAGQALFLIPSFLVCGYLVNVWLSFEARWSAALLFANPVSVITGYALCHTCSYAGLDAQDLFYFRLTHAVLWAWWSRWCLHPFPLRAFDGYDAGTPCQRHRLG